MSTSQLVRRINIDGLHPLVVGGIGTSIKWFGAVDGAVPPSVSATSGVLAFICIPGSNEMNGKRMLVRAAGDFQCPSSDATSPAVTVGLYAVLRPSIGFLTNPLVTPAIVTLASYQESATGLGVLPVPWSMLVNLQATTNSGILQGDYTIQIDNGEINGTGSPAAINSQSAITMASVIPFALAVGITWSQSGSGNTASMYQFDLQA